MAFFNVPKRDLDIVALLKQFDGAMQAHSSTLGYSSTDEFRVSGAYAEADSSLTAVEGAKFALKGAVATKSADIKDGVAIMREYAQQIKNNVAATPEIQAAFGISPTPSASGPVTVPTTLSAEPVANGTCKVTWKRNGNVVGTSFVIETKTSMSGAWSFYATTTKTKFNDTNAAPGSPKWYRVRAERGDVVSGWSNEATIYSGGSGVWEVAA